MKESWYQRNKHRWKVYARTEQAKPDYRAKKAKRAAEWYKKNKDKERERMRLWRLNNKDHRKRYDHEAYLKNRGAKEARRKREPEKFAAWRAARRSIKVNATPKWADESLINAQNWGSAQSIPAS